MLSSKLGGKPATNPIALIEERDRLGLEEVFSDQDLTEDEVMERVSKLVSQVHCAHQHGWPGWKLIEHPDSESAIGLHVGQWGQDHSFYLVSLDEGKTVWLLEKSTAVWAPTWSNVSYDRAAMDFISYALRSIISNMQ